LPVGIVAGQDTVWVTARKPGAAGQLVRIDPRTGVVRATIPVGRDPGALAVGDSDVWVANEADDTVARIDAHTNTVMATIPVVHVPVGVAIGEGAVWVVSRGSALLSLPAVSRIDPSTDAVVRMGPVALPTGVPATGDPPVPPSVLGAGTILLLAAAGEVLRRAALRGGDRPVPSGRVLGELRRRQQASRRGRTREWPAEVG
jgi:YVTN family beta-propeller protein